MRLLEANGVASELLKEVLSVSCTSALAHVDSESWIHYRLQVSWSKKPFGDPPGYSNFGNLFFRRPGRIFHGYPRHYDTLLIQQRVGIDTLSFDESFSCRNQHALGSKLNALRKDHRALLNIWNRHIFNHGDRTDYPTDQ